MTKQAKAPLNSARVRALGSLWALLFIAFGVVLVREAAASFGWTGGVWIASAFRAFDGLRPETWMVFASVGGAIVGLLLLSSALRPRRRIGFKMKSSEAVYVMPRAAASVAITAVNRVDGVWDASAKAKRRRLGFAAKASSSDSEIRNLVRTAIDNRLLAIDAMPRIKVRIRKEVAES